MRRRTKEIKIKKSTSGITLIALVVTIIVLIILAGVSINLVLGDNGIITKAKVAKEKQEISEIKEKIQMKIADKEIEKIQKGESITQSEIEEILGNYGEVVKNGEEIESLITTEEQYEIPYSDIYTKVDIKEPEVNEPPERATVSHYLIDPSGTTDDTIFCNEVTASTWWHRNWGNGVMTNYAANQYKLYEPSGSTNSNDVKIMTVPLDGSKYKSITVKCLYYYDGGEFPNGCIYLANSISGTQIGNNWYMPENSEVIQRFACGSSAKTQQYYRDLTGNSSWVYTDAIVNLSDPAWETHTFDISDYDGDIYISIFNNNGYLYVASIEIEQYADTIE